MPDKQRPVLRSGPPARKPPLPPNDEHRTAAESMSFPEMLKDALEG